MWSPTVCGPARRQSRPGRDAGRTDGTPGTPEARTPPTAFALSPGWAGGNSSTIQVKRNGNRYNFRYSWRLLTGQIKFQDCIRQARLTSGGIPHSLSGGAHWLYSLIFIPAMIPSFLRLSAMLPIPRIAASSVIIPTGFIVPELATAALASVMARLISSCLFKSSSLF